MATLEIHDGKSQVQYVTITRQTPALLGADPQCEIVVNDPKALPRHGRIRWGRGKFKVEATPEARAIEVNGKKVVMASFEQGDEIRIGNYRIFLLSPEDSPAGDEATRMQPKPAAVTNLEAGDWAANLAEGVDEADDGDEARPRRARPRRPAAEKPARSRQPAAPVAPVPVPAPAPAATKNALAYWWRRIVRTVAIGDAPPGQERILTSPLVLGLAGVLTLLVLFSFITWGVISRRTTDNLYRHGRDLYNDGDYRNSVQDFDKFLAEYPSDSRAGEVRVKRAMANVRQLTAGGSAVWSDAMTAARAMVKDVGNEAEYQDVSADLADAVLKIAEGLADRAKASADPKALAEAESAVAFHDKVGGQGAKTRRSRSPVPAKMAEATAAVKKSQTRLKWLAAMDAGIKAKSAAKVFDARDALVAAYSDLATDKAVVEHMTKATDFLRSAVTVDDNRRAAETAPRPEPLGPPFSLVLRSVAPATAAQPNDPSPPLVFVVAEGYAYALNGLNGAPLWHIPVGLTCPFPPRAVPGLEQSVLGFDARHDELVRLDARTGKLIWRQPIGERLNDPPLVLEKQVVATTPSGKLIALDFLSGAIKGMLDLHRPLTRAPVAHETNKYLYLLADEASLFVVTLDPLAVAGVEYVGHDAGSIPCAPARMGRYLVIVENDLPTEGHWLVYLLEEDGPKLKQVQSLPVPGWTTETPSGQGTILWMVTDRAGLTAYSMGPYDQKVPFKKVASLAAEAKPSGPAFAKARTERELWVASSRSARYDLDIERGRITTGWTHFEAGPALAPLQIAGRLEILTQQYTEERGVAVWGINPGTGGVNWRTILGTPWITGLTSAHDGEGLLSVALDGTQVAVPRAKLQEGGFVEVNIPAPGTFRLPTGTPQRLEIEGLSVIIPSATASQVFVREGTEPLKKVDLPSPLGAPPIPWGRDLLVPGDDGRVYLMEPKSGAMQADPYVPPFDKTKPAQWATPALLEGDAVAMCDKTGKVRRVIRQTEPRPRLVASGEEANLGGALAADPASTGAVLFVATADNRIRALAGRDFSPLGAWPLDAPRALGPIALGRFVLAADSAGALMGFEPDGKPRWTIALREGPPLGLPLVRDDSLWFLTKDGTLHRRALADGASQERHELGVLPAGGPLAVGSDLVVPVAPGTVRLLAAAKEEGTKP
jgi:hypothetical protein